jgi:hypothetical protein
LERHVRAVTGWVLTMLESPVIFLTPVDIDHMVFITKASTGHPGETD